MDKRKSENTFNCQFRQKMVTFFQITEPDSWSKSNKSWPNALETSHFVEEWALKANFSQAPGNRWTRWPRERNGPVEVEICFRIQSDQDSRNCSKKIAIKKWATKRVCF